MLAPDWHHPPRLLLQQPVVINPPPQTVPSLRCDWNSTVSLKVPSCTHKQQPSFANPHVLRILDKIQHEILRSLRPAQSSTAAGNPGPAIDRGRLPTQEKRMCKRSTERDLAPSLRVPARNLLFRLANRARWQRARSKLTAACTTCWTGRTTQPTCPTGSRNERFRLNVVHGYGNSPSWL